MTPSLLLGKAGEKVFERGQNYYDEDAVRLLYHTETEAAAELEGSQPYRVDLKAEEGKLVEDCTCPAIGQWGFCKHAVALGLYLIDNPKVTHRSVPAKHKAKTGTFEKAYPNLSNGYRMAGLKSGEMVTAVR